MTKIVTDSSLLPTDRQTTASVDQARRFAWRLQWEKAQWEHRQTCDPGSGGGRDAGPGHCCEENETPLKTSGVQSGRVVETLNQGNEILRSPHRSESSPLSDRAGVLVRTGTEPRPTPMIHSVSRSEATRPDSTVRSQQEAQRSQTRLAQPSRWTDYPSAHVYQSDGKVEVALRRTGLQANEGVKLIMGLQRDLASLGLRLTRLTLNGELLWQSQTPLGNRGGSMATDDTPIDKIY